MLIKPVFTEKSLGLAKEGKYTFLVNVMLDKGFIKSEISKLFGVHVKSIRTLKTGSEKKRNLKGGSRTVFSTKKAIVTLNDGQKIDLFEEKKK